MPSCVAFRPGQQSNFNGPYAFIATLLVTLHCAAQADCQTINLGTFNLQKSPTTGDLQIGLGQGANLFGFGPESALGLNLGPGRFGAKTDNGLLLGGRRFGLDSNLGLEQGRGLNLGSLLNLFQPIGQFVSGPAVPPPPQSATSPPFTAPIFPPHQPRQSPGPVEWPHPIGPPPSATLMPQQILPTNGGESLYQSTASEERFPSSIGEGWKGETDNEEWRSDPFEVGVGDSIHFGRDQSSSNGKVTTEETQVQKKGKVLPIPSGLEPFDVE